MNLTGEAGKRLDHFLQEHLPQFSRSRLQSWIKEGRVLVNGAAAKASLVLRGSEDVEVSPADEVPLLAAPEDLPLEVLYQDAAVIAINKPAGLVVHAGAGAESGTLVNRLVHHFATLSQVGGDLRPGIVHRLDKGTSGVLVVARNDAAHRALAAQFAGRTVEKTYLALVHGKVRDEQGRVTAPIARDPIRRIRMTTKLAAGRSALTPCLRVWTTQRCSAVSRSSPISKYASAPDARTRFGYTYPASGIQSQAISCMAHLRPRKSSCMPGGLCSPALLRTNASRWKRPCPWNSPHGWRVYN